MPNCDYGEHLRVLLPVVRFERFSDGCPKCKEPQVFSFSFFSLSRRGIRTRKTVFGLLMQTISLMLRQYWTVLGAFAKSLDINNYICMDVIT